MWKAGSLTFKIWSGSDDLAGAPTCSKTWDLLTEEDLQCHLDDGKFCKEGKCNFYMTISVTRTPLNQHLMLINADPSRSKL